MNNKLAIPDKHGNRYPYVMIGSSDSAPGAQPPSGECSPAEGPNDIPGQDLKKCLEEVRDQLAQIVQLGAVESARANIDRALEMVEKMRETRLHGTGESAPMIKHFLESVSLKVGSEVESLERVLDFLVDSSKDKRDIQEQTRASDERANLAEDANILALQRHVASLSAENAAMSAEIQALKDRLVIAEAQCDSADDERRIDIIAQLVESQRDEIAMLQKERASLVERAIHLTELVTQAETILEMKTVEEQRSQALKCSYPAHTCIGYIRELLLPKLGEEQRSAVDNALKDTSVRCNDRLRRAFDAIAEGMKQGEFQTHEILQFVPDMMQGSDIQGALQKWIETTAPATGVYKVDIVNVKKLLQALINVNQQQRQQISEMTAKTEANMKVVAELLESFGDGTGDVKECFTKLMEKLKKQQDKKRMLKEMGKTKVVSTKSQANEVTELRRKLDRARKQKKAIILEFRKRFEESEEAMNRIVMKCKESNKQVSDLHEEICKLRLANQSLEMQLAEAAKVC